MESDDKSTEGGGDLDPYPQSDRREFGYKVAKATAGALPTVGTGLGELIDSLVGSPLQRRRDKWFADLGLAVQGLLDSVKDLDLDRLAEDENFLATVYTATDAAMKTASKEKKDALRNAVLNSAVGMNLNQSIQDKFFNLLVRFTPVHLMMLSILENPKEHPLVNERATSASNTFKMLEMSISGLSGQEETLKQLYRDLLNEGLVREATMAMGTRNFAFDPMITEMGKAFLRFIDEP